MGVLVSHPAWAERDALVDKAAQYLRQGDPQSAFDHLDPYEEERAGDTDFDLALGTAANQIKRYTRAIMALERVLDANPKNVRAKTELATAYFATRDDERARDLLISAKKQGVPTNVGKTIDQFLRAIDNYSKPDSSTYGRFSHNGHITMTVGHDSNVSSASNLNKVKVPVLGDIEFDIAEKDRKHSSSFYGLSAGVSGRYTINNRWSWIGSVNGSTNGNTSDKASRFDNQNYSLSTGFAYLYERHELSFNLNQGVQLLDGARKGNTSGVSLVWAYRPDGFNQLSTYIQYAQARDKTSRSGDVNRTVIGATYSKMFRNALSVFAGVYASKEEPVHDQNVTAGNEGVGVRAGIQYSINPNLVAYMALTHEVRDFDAQSPVFLKTRRDKQYGISAGLNWSPAANWVISPSVSHSQSKSNLDLNTYTRDQISISTSYRF